MCTNIFCVPAGEVDVMYFCILCTVSTINCLVSLATAYLLFRRIFLPTPKSSVNTQSTPMAVVVPCYLPNEEAIIASTVEHILTQLVHDGPLTLHVVYNTPVGYARQEEELVALERRKGLCPPGRRLRVVKAAKSHSKAENLNLILQQIEAPFVALYDADHHPDPLSLQLLLETMLSTDTHAVQGSTYIRNTGGCGPSSWLARYLDAEFFVTHFVYFPAMEVLSQVGYFGGSNALWRTAVLRQYEFDPTMHTEDVDQTVQTAVFVAAQPLTSASP